MAVKFSQFNNVSPTPTTYLVGFDGTTNVKILYSSLLSGTTNYVSKWTSSTALGNSQIFDNGTSVGIGTATPSASYLLDLSGSFRINYSSTTPSTAQVLINPSLTSTANFQSFRVVQINPTWSNTFGNTNIFAFEAYKNARFFDESNNLQLTIDSNTVTASTSFRVGGITIYNDSTIYYGASGLRFANSNTERARFTPSGRLLIGTSTESTYELDVVGDIRSTLDANINGLTVGKGLASVSQNTAFGVTALASNTTGTAVTAIGYHAGLANTTSNHNTYIGNQSGPSATGANNTFVGSGSGFVNAAGAQNTFIGTFSGYEVTSGTYNTTLGYNTGRGITTGSYNTIIGAQVTGLSSSLSNTIILADGQGNQRFTINSSGNAGILTTSPTNLLTLVGSTTGRGIDFVSQANFASVTGKINYETTNDLFSIINASTWGNSALIFGTNNTERARFTLSGRLLIGTTTESTYILDANGTVRVQGTELRLDNATTGTINLYSATPEIRFFSGDPTGYRLYRSGTAMFLNAGGSITTQISGNDAYTLNASSGHIWRTALSGGAALARLTTGGNLIIGGTTDAGYLLDVNGTARSVGATYLGTGGNIVTFGATTAQAGYRFTFNGGFIYSNSGIDVVDRISCGNAVDGSAILQAASTTKGFLPPRMTGAQAEAITGSAAGLMVYANNGNGATITSTGWWGFNGTTWVKLN
jgi:hypothetical protein